MSSERSKLAEAAQKYFAKGHHAKALVVFRKLAELEPGDLRIWLKIGDLSARLGSHAEACAAYERVAEQYSREGFFLKAVAVFKQMLTLEPQRISAYRAIAELYERLELVSDALQAYQNLAQAYERAGDIDNCLQTLHRICELDPENVAAVVKYAEALSRAGHRDSAADAFARAAQILWQRQRLDDYVRVAERLLFHRPEDRETAFELARMYHDRQDPRRALARLQICFKANAQDVPTLEMLAKVFLQLEQPGKATTVLREIARLCDEEGRIEARARALKQILDLNPEDADARRALAAFAKPSLPPTTHVTSQPPPLDRHSLGPHSTSYPAMPERRSIATVEVMQLEQHEMEDFDEPPSNVAIPPDVEREAQMARFVTEAEVFARYGLNHKAEEQLVAALQLDPQHLIARQRLKDLYLQLGKTVEAAFELEKLAELSLTTNPELASAYVQQAEQLRQREPEPQYSSEPQYELPLTENSALHARDASAARIQLPAEEVLSNDDEVFFVDDSALESVDSPALEDLSSSQSEMRRRSAVVGIAALEIEGGPRQSSVAPSPPQTTVSAAPPAVPLSSIEEVLDEAEFYSHQGLLDEAQRSLQQALERFPHHTLILERLRDLEDAVAAQNNATLRPDAAPSPASEIAVIGAQLAEELDPVIDVAGSQMIDVETVFAQFKKGVAKQVAADDSDTHFDLGIAYKEMGLLDDAVQEFQASMVNPRRQCLALTMMGLCYLEKANVAEAIAHFKQGLYIETKTPQEELGLYYELGSAYERLSDSKEALYYYQKVQRHQPDFRDVSRKVQSLSGLGDAAVSMTQPPR